MSILRGLDLGAVAIGRVEGAGSPGLVKLRTLGGDYPLDMLTGDQLPRIC